MKNSSMKNIKNYNCKSFLKKSQTWPCPAQSKSLFIIGDVNSAIKTSSSVVEVVVVTVVVVLALVDVVVLFVVVVNFVVGTVDACVVITTGGTVTQFEQLYLWSDWL